MMYNHFHYANKDIKLKKKQDSEWYCCDYLGSISKLILEIWFPIAISAFSDSDSFQCISRNSDEIVAQLD